MRHPCRKCCTCHHFRMAGLLEKYMSYKLAQLREQRNIKAKLANDINNNTPVNRRMPAAETEKLDAVLAEIEAIDGEIAREHRRTQILEEDPASAGIALRNAATRDPSRQTGEAMALRAFLAGGVSNMADTDRTRMLARQTTDIRNAMSTTTSTEGGFTVATEYQK